MAAALLQAACPDGSGAPADAAGTRPDAGPDNGPPPPDPRDAPDGAGGASDSREGGGGPADWTAD